MKYIFYLLILFSTLSNSQKFDERVDNLIQENIEETIELRRWFHQNAELSNREFKTAERIAAAEVQKQQALTAQKAELKQLESQLEMQRLTNEAQLKKDLMQLEFQMNMQLKGLEVESTKFAIKEKEDRKDERTKIQASQQSELINQRKNNLIYLPEK